MVKAGTDTVTRGSDSLQNGKQGVVVVCLVFVIVVIVVVVVFSTEVV
jgi:hypothetical protein